MVQKLDTVCVMSLKNQIIFGSDEAEYFRFKLMIQFSEASHLHYSTL